MGSIESSLEKFEVANIVVRIAPYKHTHIDTWMLHWQSEAIHEYNNMLSLLFDYVQYSQVSYIPTSHISGSYGQREW